MHLKKLAEIFFIFFFVFNSQILVSQDKEDLKSIFVEAESYFLYEEYNEALGLYLQLARTMPENANINYKLGRCYLHNPYKKELSIPYLEKASKNTTEKYNIKSFKEVQAPLEVFYYLGEAYRVTNQLDKAVETYTYFLETIDEEVYDKTLVEDQIEACKRAKTEMKAPIYYEARNLGAKINTSRIQSNAVLSGDGKQLAFITKLPFYDAIFYTEKDKNGWKEPRNLTPEIKVDGATFPTCISFDGTEMYLYKLDDYNGNLYVTRLENDKWTEPVELEGINTKYWESHASISKDKQTLYLTSNRPGGFGDLDIYVSKRISNFKWGEPQNLGSTINSRYNDDTPFITADGKSLYFASLGHKTMGGYDIFVSDYNNSDWTEPKNIGYPINTTSDELFFMPFINGVSGFMPMIREEGYGLYDIYEVEIFSELNPRKIRLKGKVKTADADLNFERLLVEVFNKSNNKKISESEINNQGDFELMGQSGDIMVKISGKGIQDYTSEINLPLSFNEESFTLEPELQKAGLFSRLESNNEGEEDKTPYLEFELDVIKVEPGDAVEIKFRSDRGVDVEVEAVADNKVYYEDSFTTRRKRNSISFEPQPGTSIVSVKITDNDGNSIQKMVTVMPSEENEPLDESVAQVVAANTAREDNFEIMLHDLISISEGEIRTTLKSIEKEGQINTFKEVITKLYNESENWLFTIEEVDELLAKYAAQLIESYNIKQVKNMSKPELASSLNQLMTNDSQVNSTIGLIEKYFGLSASFDMENLLPVLINLAKNAANDFEQLNNILSGILSQEGLTEETKKFESQLFNDEKLRSYFTEIISGENAEDIYKKILEKLLIEGYIENAHENAKNGVKDILSSLLNNDKELKNSQSLVDYLFSQSLAQGIGKEEIIKLLFELNKSIQVENVDETLAEDKPVKEETVNNNKQIFWFAGGGLILIIWLILFLRRRKNKGTN